MSNYILHNGVGVITYSYHNPGEIILEKVPGFNTFNEIEPFTEIM